MNIWLTIIDAIDVRNGEMGHFEGPRIKSLTQVTAQQYCIDNGLPYCRVVGRLSMEGNMDATDIIDYDEPKNN